MKENSYGGKKVAIELKQVRRPQLDGPQEPVVLTDETMKKRKEQVLQKMVGAGLDTLVIYCDLEHGGNFSYLTGFVTRFEESLLVLHQTGAAFLVLGNENLKMAAHSRIGAEVLHCPYFSLPDQPMVGERPLHDILADAGIKADSRVGVVGWKMFTSTVADNRQLFDLPYFVMAALKQLVSAGAVENWTDLFIHSGYGVRSVNNANEIAHYEFGSALASDGVLRAIAEVAVGKSELVIADHLVRYGQPTNVIPIAATGQRFEKAVISPTGKTVKLGDKLSITTGFKGGLASRSGYAVKDAGELPAGQGDYLEQVAKPYYQAVVAWLEQVRIGMTGGELYQVVERVLPKSTYKWHLNPGHLTADEEWLSSPMKRDSEVVLQSGMLLQIDIIPSVAGYAGASCENGIALADEKLQADLARAYPEVWQRIAARRAYIIEELGIDLPEEVLPLSSGVAYYTPYFLAQDLAFVKV